MVQRKRRRNTWFPTIGTDGPFEADNDNIAGRIFSLVVPLDATTTVAIAPLVPDVPLEGDDINTAAPGQLVQALGQEYILERLVGKFHCGMLGVRADINNPTTWASCIVGLGFFVARAEDSSSGGPDTPIGSATPAERVENYNPLGEDTIREPWIWRRTWVLGNPAQDPRGAYTFATGIVSNQTLAVFPPTTGDYGSVMDGPHIDAKSNRRVGNDERLWVAVSTVGFQRTNGDTYPISVGSNGQIDGYLDYRVLGRLVRAHNRSAF